MSFSNTDTGSKPADPYTQKNLENPDSLKEKVGDLVDFVENHKFCMMTTRIKSGLLASRCMAIAAKVSSTPPKPRPPLPSPPRSAPPLPNTDAGFADRRPNPPRQEGNGVDLVFHTNTESGKTDDLDFDNDINIAFLTPSGEWASVSGKATVETDRAQVKKYYSPALKAWIGDLGDGIHDGGPDDPRVGLIKVKAVTAQYAISKRTTVGGLAEFAKGVVTGSSPQVHKLRYLNEQELQQCE